MGKASRWFRNLLGLSKKPDSKSSHHPPPPASGKQKTRWSFVKSYREKQHPTIHQFATQQNDSHDQNETSSLSNDTSKHAIAVAAATAAAAEAAVAAAQAAAEVVRLTSGAGNSTAAYVNGRKDEEVWAALKIQSAFRGYLARRALRALKGLVKIQALVRGHIERKRVAEWVHQMQVLMRAQARARAERSQISESSQSSSRSSHFQHPGPITPEKVEHGIRVQNTKQDQSPAHRRNSSRSSGRNSINHERQFGQNSSDRRLDERSWEQRGHSVRNDMADDEKNDKILEVDMGKPVFTPKRKHPVQSYHYSLSDHSITTSKDSTAHQMDPSPSCGEVQSLSPLKFSQDRVEEGAFCTAENSPQFFSASSRGGSSRRSPFTPTKSDSCRSYFSGYSGHPNYMANTESSRAKARSLSAPKQRPQFEKSNSTKRYSIHGFGDRRSYSQKITSLHADFTNKAYPGSGRLDRLGLPLLRGDNLGYRF